MKRIIIAFLLVLNIGIAYAADKKITSKTYVDNQLATKQDKIPAVDTNTVITHTGESGNIGEKGIYDSTGNYAEQQTSLVTAGDANTGINNALENEFVCVDTDTDGTCLIWEIRPAKLAQLPNEYTALEYLTSDKNECITTNVRWGDVYKFNGRAQQTIVDTWNEAIFGSSSTEHTGMYGTYYESATATKYWYWVRSISYLDIGEFNFSRIGSTNTWRGTVNNNVSQGSINVENSDKVRLLCTGYTNRWFTGNVWYLQLIGVNGDFLLNAVPVKRNSDGLVGFYDFVSNQMLTNSGSGTFVAGPVASYIPQGQ